MKLSFALNFILLSFAQTVEGVVSSEAPTGTPTEAPTSCDVDAAFLVDGKLKQDCTWVAKKGADSGRRKKLCTRNDVRGACPSACGFCCADNPDFTFTAIGGKTQDCAWITKNFGKKEIRLRECKKNKVKAACQLTCDNCFTPPVCADNPDFTFTIYGGITVPCGWILRNRKKKERRLRKCKENKVKAACQLTCDNCFTFPPV
jgi:hypothetical protein